MNNGCVCCTVRGDLIRVLQGLMKRQATQSRAFDAIIIETTGLADPGPVAQTFFVDEDVKARTRLDSVTTVVDAKHILISLGESREAREQIAFADQIVLNKTDLVSAADLSMIESRLRRLNPLAAIHQYRHLPVRRRAGQPVLLMKPPWGGLGLQPLVGNRHANAPAIGAESKIRISAGQFKKLDHDEFLDEAVRHTAPGRLGQKIGGSGDPRRLG